MASDLLAGENESDLQAIFYYQRAAFVERLLIRPVTRAARGRRQ
jgi:hypothetical protein